MNQQDSPTFGVDDSKGWFCVRSQPKHEHIAAARLRTEGIEVYLPRIRFKKASARGPVWVTEALFPNYFFALFNWRESSRLVRHASGVSTVVHFGPTVPTVPAEVIAELRARVGEQEVHILPEKFAEGDAVQLTTGPLRGLAAVVTQVMPAKERVRVLLTFLGRQTEAEVDQSGLVKEAPPRRELL
jgi:transcriptional antiterminator RfaH